MSLKNVSRHQDRNVVKNSRVLIAVEAALVALELELSLQQSGIETHSVGNVADAIRMIDAKQPDVAIIDSRLGSEDTLGIGRRLVSSNTRFLLLDDSGNTAADAHSGATVVIQKPVYAHEIVKHLERLLSE